jgi:pyridoxal phosphate enzyme (YggS family)
MRGNAAADVRARLAVVGATIAASARRAGRRPEAIQIVAVTKTFPVGAIVAAIAAGLEHIGENYVQEAEAKRDASGGAGVWHLIGGLQRNKARTAAVVFDWVHSLDSAALAGALSRHAIDGGRRLDVLIQVNVAGAPGQRGVAPDAVAKLAADVARLDGVVLRGLMTIAPADAPESAIRMHFRQLRDLRDDLARSLGVELPHLSMGMSDDFAIAVEEGATLLRLGRALFGPRGPRSWREGS